MPPITTLTSVGRGVSFGRVRKPRVSAAAGYSPAIPTDNLYSHWDFSLLSDDSGTTYSVDSDPIADAVGTTIGASSNTPQIRYRRTSGPSDLITVTTTNNGNKCLSIPQRSGTVNYGAFLQSDGDAFPNITSTTDSYTWVAVWRHTTSLGGWTRMYRWYLNGYNYDFNHGTWWNNPSGSELNFIHYASSQRYASSSTPASHRSNISIMHYEIVTITNRTAEVSYVLNNITRDVNHLTMTAQTTILFGTQVDANRYFQIRPTNYAFNTNYPALLACEYAFYNRAMDQTERTNVIQSLQTKWGNS